MIQSTIISHDISNTLFAYRASTIPINKSCLIPIRIGYFHRAIFVALCNDVMHDRQLSDDINCEMKASIGNGTRHGNIAKVARSYEMVIQQYTWKVVSVECY